MAFWGVAPLMPYPELFQSFSAFPKNSGIHLTYMEEGPGKLGSASATQETTLCLEVDARLLYGGENSATETQ